MSELERRGVMMGARSGLRVWPSRIDGRDGAASALVRKRAQEV